MKKNFLSHESVKEKIAESNICYENIPGLKNSSRKHFCVQNLLWKIPEPKIIHEKNVGPKILKEKICVKISYETIPEPKILLNISVNFALKSENSDHYEPCKINPAKKRSRPFSPHQHWKPGDAAAPIKIFISVNSPNQKWRKN